MITAIPLSQQIIVFIVIMAAGLLTGLLFDLMRAVSRVLQIPKSFLFPADMLLSLCGAFIVYQVLYMFNQGELRFFVYLSFFLGIVFYYYFCSRHLYKQASKYIKIPSKTVAGLCAVLA
jgi:spore cortex biosynthesis protein YabQ